MSTDQATELQAAFNKQKEIDPLHYEECVQKKILKLQSKGELVRQNGNCKEHIRITSCFKKWQNRSSYYTDSQDAH